MQLKNHQEWEWETQMIVNNKITIKPLKNQDERK